MPILAKDSRPFKKVILPSSTPEDQAWAEVYQKVNTDDIIEVSKHKTNQEMATVVAAWRVIKDWNFTDPEGKKLPVTLENVGYLEFDDLIEIGNSTTAYDKINELTKVKKNNLSSSSQPNTTEKEPMTQPQ